MKKLFLILLMMLICASFAQAKSLKWDASTGDVDGYIVYYTDGSDTWNKATTETSMDLAELNLTPGTYSLWVKAYNEMGESGSSNIVEHPFLPWTVPDDNVKPATLIIPDPVENPTII